MRFTLAIALLAAFFTLPMAHAAQSGDIKFTPVGHASFVMEVSGKTIFVDPVGKAAQYAAFKKPDIIMITHDHPDHFAPDLLYSLKTEKTVLIGPKIVADRFRGMLPVDNGGGLQEDDVNIQAVPAYNTTPARLGFHPKGVGNGYVVSAAGKKVYISGDTEDLPDMRALKSIDYAFICMNLPYTMSEEQAASAVKAFRPKVVFPYHFRNKTGPSDLKTFKALLAGEKDIEVRVLKWY